MVDVNVGTGRHSCPAFIQSHSQRLLSHRAGRFVEIKFTATVFCHRVPSTRRLIDRVRRENINSHIFFIIVFFLTPVPVNQMRDANFGARLLTIQVVKQMQFFNLAVGRVDAVLQSVEQDAGVEVRTPRPVKETRGETEIPDEMYFWSLQFNRRRVVECLLRFDRPRFPFRRNDPS